MSRHRVIRGGRVIDHRRRRLEACDILVEGTRIAEIGPPGMAVPAEAAVTEAADRLIIPGLVNAHTHSHASIPRSMGDRWTLEMGLNANPAIRGVLSLADKKLAARITAAELASKGCTAAYDLFYEFPVPTVEGLQAVAEAYLEVGIRAVIAPMVADGSFYAAVPGLLQALPADVRARIEAQPRYGSREAIFAVIGEAVRTWPFDTDRVRLAVAPSIPLHCSDAFLSDAARLSREWGIGLHTHVAESKPQAVGSRRRWGTGLVERLAQLGVLGPSFTAAHAIWLDEADYVRLAEAGASVAHNPGSNMRLGNGIPPVRRMRVKGVNVGIGTDARGSGDNLNMFESMRLASFCSRMFDPDPATWLATDEVVEMATRGSARALGLDRLTGAIEPGLEADLVLLDAKNLNYVPLNNPVNQLVNCEDGTGVAAVLCGGRPVVEDGQVLALDRDRLAAQAQASLDRLLASSAEARSFADGLAEAVGGYCLGLAREPLPFDRYISPTAPF